MVIPSIIKAEKMQTIKIVTATGIVIFFMTLTVAPIYARSGISQSGGSITCCSTKDGTCCVVQPATHGVARTQKADYRQKLAVLEEKIRHAMDDLDAAGSNSNGKIRKSLQQKVEMLEKKYWKLKMVE